MLRFAHHYGHHDAWLGISILLLLGAKSEEEQTPPSLGPGFHLQFWVLPAEGRALTSPPPPPAHPIPVFKSGECSFCLSSFRCLQEDPEIWDISWKLCSPGVSGLRGNSEPTQDGVGNRALMGGREDPPYTHTPPPGPELLASADKPSSLFYRTSLEAPWTDSHPQLTSIPLTAL